MPTFVMERDIPGAGKLTAAELPGIPRKSCGVLEGMPAVQWLHSFVTDAGFTASISRRTKQR